MDPGAGRPRELIFNSVSNFGPEGPKNSSGGDSRVATSWSKLVPYTLSHHDRTLLRNTSGKYTAIQMTLQGPQAEKTLQYHCLQNHCTHDITISNYFGDYSYSFQGSVETLQLQFPCYFCRMQLQRIVPLRNVQGFDAITVTCLKVFEFRM